MRPSKPRLKVDTFPCGMTDFNTITVFNMFGMHDFFACLCTTVGRKSEDLHFSNRTALSNMELLNSSRVRGREMVWMWVCWGCWVGVGHVLCAEHVMMWCFVCAWRWVYCMLCGFRARDHVVYFACVKVGLVHASCVPSTWSRSDFCLFCLQAKYCYEVILFATFAIRMHFAPWMSRVPAHSCTVGYLPIGLVVSQISHKLTRFISLPRVSPYFIAMKWNLSFFVCPTVTPLTSIWKEKEQQPYPPHPQKFVHTSLTLKCVILNELWIRSRRNGMELGF